MVQGLTETIISLLIISPLILISFNREKRNLKAIVIFFVFYILFNIVLVKPLKIEVLRLINGTYNWTGKVYSVLFTILSYSILKKYLKEENYFTVKQKAGFKKLTFILIFAPLIVVVLMNIVFNSSNFSVEDLLFQLSLPGVEEEMVYRGVLLKLLSVNLNKQFKMGRLYPGNSTLFITSILFGLAHGLTVDDNWNISIIYSNIVFIGSLGYLYGLITYL